jgi:hypothetical protein
MAGTEKDLHLKIPLSAHKRMRMAAASKGVTIRQLLLDAFDAYVKKPKEKAA